VSQFFRSRRNSAARKVAPLTMMPATVIAASQAWEFFLRGGAATGGRSRLQYRQTRAWRWMSSLQNGQIRVRMPITL